jgi:hypothetical protein
MFKLLRLAPLAAGLVKYKLSAGRQSLVHKKDFSFRIIYIFL